MIKATQRGKNFPQQQQATSLNHMINTSLEVQIFPEQTTVASGSLALTFSAVANTNWGILTFPWRLVFAR